MLSYKLQWKEQVAGAQSSILITKNSYLYICRMLLVRSLSSPIESILSAPFSVTWFSVVSRWIVGGRDVARNSFVECGEGAGRLLYHIRGHSARAAKIALMARSDLDDA